MVTVISQYCSGSAPGAEGLSDSSSWRSLAHATYRASPLITPSPTQSSRVAVLPPRGWPDLHHDENRLCILFTRCLRRNFSSPYIKGLRKGDQPRQQKRKTLPEFTSSHGHTKVTTICRTTIDEKAQNLPKMIFDN